MAATAYASCYEPNWELETYDINALDGDIVTDIDYDALFVTHVNEENPQDVFVGFMIIGALLSIGGPGGAAILVIP